MKGFFDGVRRHLGKMDAGRLREQYARLSDEAASLDTLFRTISIGIVVLDQSGQVVKDNPAAKDLLGMDPRDAVPALGIPPGSAGKREMDVSYPEKRILEIQFVPAGSSGSIVYIRDITAERARTEEELRAGADKAVRDLAAGVAHEIGNPLNAISLNLQLLKRDGGDSETVDECLRQVGRLEGILRGFLTALRPVKPNLKVGFLSAPISNCLKTLETQFEQRGISVTLDIAASVPSTAMDSAQMEQVFFNLLKNAMEAVSEGGCIDISLSCDDEDVIAKVRDNGAGIPQEALAHLFEPYRTTKSGGNGLGLMVSSRIIHDHGGSISVQSSEDAGTEFTVRLPRLEKRIRALK